MATSHFFNRSAKRDHPAAGPSLVDQAITLYESGKAGEAESLMRRAIESEPRDRRGPHLLAVLCRLRGAHAESCQWLDRAMALEPNCGQLQLELGNTLRE